MAFEDHVTARSKVLWFWENSTNMDQIRLLTLTIAADLNLKRYATCAVHMLRRLHTHALVTQIKLIFHLNVKCNSYFFNYVSPCCTSTTVNKYFYL